MNDQQDGASSAPRRRSAARPLVLGLTIAVVAAIAAAGGFFLGHGGRFSASPQYPVLGQAPSYQLTNQLGQTVNSKAFRGKIQIVTFLDPYCSDFCPLIAVHLANFAANFRGSPYRGKLVFVAFNVDPWQTGVPQMRGFLKEFGWNPADPKLQFLTGSVAETMRVVRQGFHVDFERVPSDNSSNAPVLGTPGHLQLVLSNPLADKAKPRYDIIHNDSLEIVDGKGRIRKIFSEADRVDDRQLMQAVDALLPTTR